MNKYPQLQDTEVIKALESSVSSTIDIIFGSLIFVGVTLQISFLTTGDVIHSIISGILLMLLVAVFFCTQIRKNTSKIRSNIYTNCFGNCRSYLNLYQSWRINQSYSCPISAIHLCMDASISGKS